MSHLATPRIVIAGRFISEVSTLNNVEDNFDPSKPLTPLWNPRGGATFDFYACGVTAAVSSQGPVATDDPVLALAVSGAVDRPSAKMVDLDPDWQQASEIWGLTVRLLDRATGESALQGSFQVAPFRDLFTRQLAELLANAGRVPNGQPSGARYVSTLTNVTWGPVAARSALLRRLRAETEGDELAIALNVFGYFYSDEGRHATGELVGCIGPRRQGEPRTFVAARRLQALPPVTIQGRARTLIGAADAAVDGSSAIVDLGNALLISDVVGTPTDLSQIGPSLGAMRALAFGVLPDESHASGAILSADVPTIFGEIDYLRPGWYRQTGGIASFQIDPQAAQHAATRPLALFGRMADGSFLTLTRETSDGLFVRADNFVHRLDPGDPADVVFFARRRGLPAANLKIHLAFSPFGNNDPPAGLDFAASTVTDADGKGTLHIEASDPGNARPNIDGQLYALAYSSKLDANGGPDYSGTGLSPVLDAVAAHVRTAFAIPDRPEWHRDVEPFMAQYSRLYPIMSRHLFDLGDYAAVAKHRRLLRLAFERPIEDPNHMPVTRDLSGGKRATILKWLSNETGDPNEPLVKGAEGGPPPVSPSMETVARPSARARLLRAAGEDDVKRAAAQLTATASVPGPDDRQT